MRESKLTKQLKIELGGDLYKIEKKNFWTIGEQYDYYRAWGWGGQLADGRTVESALCKLYLKKNEPLIS